MRFKRPAGVALSVTTSLARKAKRPGVGRVAGFAELSLKFALRGGRAHRGVALPRPYPS